MTGSRGEMEDDCRPDDRGDGSLAGTSSEGFLDDRGEGVKSNGEGPRGDVIRSEFLDDRGEKSRSVEWSRGETILSIGWSRGETILSIGWSRGETILSDDELLNER